jgi:kumamolisin
VKARRKVLGAIVAPLPIAALALYAPSASAAPAPRAVLHGDVVSAIAHSTRTGAVAANASISVAVSLAPRDEAALDAFLAQVTDPKSPLYKHYLTVPQFAARFGASPAAVKQVTDYLKSQGLKVTSVTANNLTVNASGSAAQVAKAFGTSLATYHDAATKRDYFANTAAPSLPAGIAANVVDISGLSSYGRSVHYSQADNAVPHATSKAVTGLTPTTARKAYNLTSTESAGYDGAGETIGLIEFSAYTQSDVTKYDSNFSLSVSTPTVVKADGGTTDTSGKDEVELDIEVIQALAPGAAIKVYEAPNSDAGEVAMYSAIVSADVPVISISWGEYEAGETSSNRTALNTDFKQAAAQGESVYAASGDSGSDDEGNGGTTVDFPASDTYVTGTGGTTLSYTSSTGTYKSETAWDGSGGGVSSYFATPSFQSPVNSGSYRDVPDVAAVADPSTGWAIYEAGSWQEFGGTSAAAPNWAAFTAIYDEYAADNGGDALGYANSTIYALAQTSSYSSAFHDVKSGSNGAYSAATGYDKVTGWGSYNGANFISAELG